MITYNVSKYSLVSIREVWRNACVEGETDWLEFIETPNFILIEERTTISRAEQIAHLQRKKRSFPRATDFQYHETIHRVDEHQGWATVVGSFESHRNGVALAKCDFAEFWLVVDGRWRVASVFSRNKLSAQDAM
jgi:hypothetical protein